MNKQAWSAALESLVERQRDQSTIPERKELSDEAEWQCRIIGGEFIGWYRQHLPEILSQRAALRVMNFDPTPIIVFTTSVAGLAAARQIMPEAPNNLVYLLHSEFETWKTRHPADDFTFHVHHWSYFAPLDKGLLKRAQQAFPTVNAEEFRVHVSGDLWGERCGVEGKHLWRWNGWEMELLEEALLQTRF